MRYFIKLSYRGTAYVGWQRQPNGLSVQQCIEENLAKLLRLEVPVVGCGRTDAGVHASEYYAHFDWDGVTLETNKILNHLNRMLPADIAIDSLTIVPDTLHARFSATKRTYHYYLNGQANPFQEGLVYHYYYFKQLDWPLMQQMADLLKKHKAFFPFCKTHSDVDHYLCEISDAQWEGEGQQMVFRISANRFLRGMVRLIVGMSLQVGMHKVPLDDVRLALEQQKTLAKSLSAPAQGLFLTKIEYPELPTTGE
ncbi:MAG: tRNA pseudouridine(38-40) synthase TruA [Saprospiraceae bacterium]|nr:tRNA pseudouridine(38-40) synthase TruA [Saprospiraceae bacterium]